MQAKRRRWTAAVTAHATAATALHTTIIATAGLTENPSNPGPNSVKRAHTKVPRIAILPMPP